MEKVRLFLDFHKEEKWLESMSEQGWQLKKQGFMYTFQSTPPQRTNIKIDYRHFKSQQDFLDYCSLFEDSGWQHISGTKYSGNQYFKQISDDSHDDIFSDDMSRAGRYKRLANMMLSLFIMFTPFIIISIQQGTFGLEVFTNPRGLYLTPGLWEMSGPQFWSSFLFETPFALMRGLSSSLSLGFVLAYILAIIKSWTLYKKAMKLDSVE